MSELQPPPTYAEVILIDERTQRATFNPIWLGWFLDLVQVLNESGAGGGAVNHNSTSGLQGGTTNQYYHLTAAQQAIVAAGFAHGTYTPALVNVANLDASTAYQCQYLRLGNTVFVSGLVDVNPTLTATATQLGISLPIASNLGAVEDCAGAAAASGIAGQSAAIIGDAANNRAEMQWVAGDITNQPMYFTFGYQVI